ncbi:MAG: hypothetical protein WBY88_01025 [Desulfosarcina sp.]
MTLSKLEIQQMLREMNVKFDAHETLEALKQRLQEENHRRWLRSTSGGQTRAGESQKNLVRKRKKAVAPPDQALTPPVPPAPQEASAPPEAFNRAAEKKTALRIREPAPVRRPAPIEKPPPGQPWKTTADGTEPFNRKKNVFDSVLRRADMCCECCGCKAQPGADGVGLEPYHIEALAAGGEHSIKNVVAICPGCRELLEKNPDPKIIKELKRKSRSKLYGSLEVVRKKTVHSRRRSSNRRK